MTLQELRIGLPVCPHCLVAKPYAGRHCDEVDLSVLTAALVAYEVCSVVGALVRLAILMERCDDCKHYECRCVELFGGPDEEDDYVPEFCPCMLSTNKRGNCYQCGREWGTLE